MLLLLLGYGQLAAVVPACLALTDAAVTSCLLTSAAVAGCALTDAAVASCGLSTVSCTP